MIYLTKTEEGFGVWDGMYVHYLNKVSCSISKTRLPEPPARASWANVPIEAMALQQYVMLQKRWEESRWTSGWLPVILEFARETDTLTKVLLNDIDRSGHEADLQNLPKEDSQWFMCHATIPGENGSTRGQWMYCSWGNADCGLWLLGEGGRKLCQGPPPKFKAAWFLVGSQQRMVSIVNSGLCTPIGLGDLRIKLTWDEAILQCGKWMQQTGALHARCDPKLVSMLLDHRRKRFGLALLLARVRGSKKQLTSLKSNQSKVDALEEDLSIPESRIGVLETELAGLKAQVSLTRGELTGALKKTKELESHLQASRDREEVLSLHLKDVNARCNCLSTENEQLCEEIKGQQSKAAMLQQAQEVLEKKLVVAQERGSLLEDMEGIILECMALRTENLECRKCTSELRLTQHKVVDLKKTLKLSQDQAASMAKEHNTLLMNLKHGQASSCRGDGGSSNGLKLECNVLPTASEALQEWQAVKRELLDMYFDYFYGSMAGKICFGIGIATSVTGMYDIMKEGYDEYVRGLVDLLACSPKAAKLAMDFHCKQNWTKLFHCESNKECSPPGLAAKGKQTENVNWTRKDVYDPFGFKSGGISEISNSENEAGQNFLRKECPSHTAIQVEALCESVVQHLQVQHSLDEQKLTKLKDCFHKLWRLTVAFFLQKPQYKFSGNLSCFGVFSGEMHNIADSIVEQGAKVVVLTPSILVALHPKPSVGHGPTRPPLHWALQEKATVDSFY